MKIAYIRWSDASYGNDDRSLDGLSGTVKLHAVGFLHNEDHAETVTLSMEHQDGETTSRLWMVIPKCNIEDMRVMEVGKKLPKSFAKSPAATPKSPA